MSLSQRANSAIYYRNSYLRNIHYSAIYFISRYLIWLKTNANHVLPKYSVFTKICFVAHVCFIYKRYINKLYFFMLVWCTSDFYNSKTLSQCITQKLNVVFTNYGYCTCVTEYTLCKCKKKGCVVFLICELQVNFIVICKGNPNFIKTASQAFFCLQSTSRILFAYHKTSK